ncbi:MAG TPA: PA domain-containing protein [Actinomycetota bacterium]|nr:PA domain-containing protein [Actinomycetota bacterium]
MRRHLILPMALVLIAALGAGVAAAPSPNGVDERQDPGVHAIDDGIVDTPLEEHAAHGHDHQHGTNVGHISPTQENVDLVGVWTAPRTKNKPGRITDVWSLGDYAYLGTFAPPCSGLGVNVVDISDPENPQKANFLPSGPGNRVNDVKAYHFETSAFSGDLLLHTNENCNTNNNRVGGMTIYDVTDPENAVRLAKGVGDTNGGTLPRARQIHNIFAWQDGSNAYAAIVDDEELLDVDIMDITDPSNPVHIGETGLPHWPSVNVDGFGENAFVHDIWYQIVDGTPTLLLSYWDAGWIKLDVSDPSDPVFIPPDSDYPNPDPLVLAATGQALQPEGNAHAGVWSQDGSLILAGDEDFSPYRLSDMEVTEQTAGGVPGQPSVGTMYPAGEFGWTVPIASIDDGILNGPVAFGGYACDESPAVPDASVLDPFINPDAPSTEEKILVVQRGPVGDPDHTYPACFFSIKVENGQDAGYDAVIVANHHIGAGGGSSPDAFICGSQGHAFTVTAHGLCTGHRAMHELFGTTPSYAEDYSGEDAPGLGDVGPKIQVTAEFDGWGPFHLLDNDSMEEIDAYAPSEVYDEDFAQGFGDLTMHNVEYYGTDKAVISWYSLGLRVLDYGDCTAAPDEDFSNQDDPGCVEEVGRFIDEGGNNFWGVHVDDGTGLILASDRDRGLYIFDFTG